MKILKGMIFLILLISHFSHASFQLETMTVILDSEEPRKIFNVKNTGSEPILLSTKVSDLDKQHEIAKNIIITPPITRIEPDQSQNINFILKDGIEFDDEQILKASFQGIGVAKVNSTKMPIRQDIAMLIIPKGLTIEREPWKNLEVKQVNNQLILKNNGKQIIRMAPAFSSLPSNNGYSIGQFYIRPQEEIKVDVKEKLTEIKISPLSRYGFKLAGDIKMKVNN
ncbi:fimbria/pilus chaperone family protein [Proteus mirabilis]|uniref:fimbria/pilus chaperone family protein n=1 Tax=Proteus mirabilis TaxID=584 RepID=UPI00234B6FFA|nr:fimbria/pilus chaperone family protein [Proteus mirabilis]MDC5889390.1 fimbria/pilus chaperone family protein [Proteus mirabilis]MDC5896471.1 fimbria/pilus chaperone family protein [Proteus mirabilis]MDC5906987.1 fimbria/pilus chaperone family protein [Proteus mirabilis]MDC5910526.1 fimbria/pilus chaperone family protein [Proteus mirabilis]MDC5917607.1 fimbria/pilus chaperone family protein [Proteus mirabilis]